MWEYKKYYGTQGSKATKNTTSIETSDVDALKKCNNNTNSVVSYNIIQKLHVIYVVQVVKLTSTVVWKSMCKKCMYSRIRVHFFYSPTFLAL